MPFSQMEDACAIAVCASRSGAAVTDREVDGALAVNRFLQKRLPNAKDLREV